MSRLRAPGPTACQAKPPRPPAIDIAAAAWAPDVPDWVAALAAACDAPGSSQGRVAKRLRLSRATVSLLLARKYRSGTARVEALIRGVLMREAVQCPVLGDLTRDRCVELQGRPKPCNGDPVAHRLYAACRAACPHSRLKRS